MASFTTLLLTLLLFISSNPTTFSQPEPPLQLSFLTPQEQESAYKVLESINSGTDWRSLYPDDLCFSGPHGLLCDYFTDDNGNVSYHIVELSFGFVSDYSPNPSCSANPSFSPHLTELTHLRKLFFYKCFTQTQIWLPGFFSELSSTLQELIFIENPSLYGTLGGKIGNLTHLKKLVVTGSSVSGEIPGEIGDLIELEQVTLARNRFNGEVPVNIGKLKNLKVLDLSFNGFEGKVPDSIGDGNKELVKLDLGSNHFSGRVPESFVGLQRLEFLDLSYNHFGNYGVPLFLPEIQSLKEVYLSGNHLGGEIPEIWEKMGGILGLGFSGLGLVGKIPASMGVHLRNICYLGLDNNALEGTVPEELGFLESVHELNLENNNLSGRVPVFLLRSGGKLKLKGNSELCVDEGLVGHSGKSQGGLGDLRMCSRPDFPNAVIFSEGFNLQQSCHGLIVLWGFWFFLVWLVFYWF